MRSKEEIMTDAVNQTKRITGGDYKFANVRIAGMEQILEALLDLRDQISQAPFIGEEEKEL